MAIPGIVTAQTQVNPQFFLNAATRAIRAHCGWHVAPIITETLELDGSGGTTLLLPSQRVRSLVKVTNNGNDVTDEVRYSRRAGILTLASGWSTEVGSISVELEHGYEVDEVPDVAALIVSLTKRASDGGLVAQQSIGGASVRYTTGRDGGVHSLPLLDSEKSTLAPYALHWGP